MILFSKLNVKTTNITFLFNTNISRSCVRKSKFCQPMTNSKLSEISDEEKRFRIKAGIFLASVAGVAAIAGFSKTLAASKKQEQVMLEKGVIENARLLDAGSSLAMRALGWGTLCAFLGTCAFSYSVWKLSGATNMKEFRHKMGTILPKLSKDGPPTSRTEFEGLRDLMEYVSTWRTEK